MTSDTVISKVSKEKLGGIVLKEEQKLTVESLLDRKNVLTVLPTGFGKSLIFRVFVEAVDRGGFRGGGVGGVHPLLRTESALFSREFSVKQCRKSALNYRNTPPPPWDE